MNRHELYSCLFTRFWHFLDEFMVCSRILCPPRSQKRLGPPIEFLNLWTNYGEQDKHWKCKFSNVLLTWYKSNLWRKKFNSNTKLSFKYCISLSKCRLSEERSAIAHLSTHLKYILNGPLSRTLNIPCSGSKKSFS